MLPLDCIRYILTFLSFYDGIQLVSRTWLSDALKNWREFIPHKWRQKLHLYSHHIIMDSKEDYWAFFCHQIIDRRKRKRDDQDELTWKAAATNYMVRGWGCRACGWPTTSNVFGTRICLGCRQNPFLKHAFMLKVYQALSWATRKQLQTIPYHGGPMNGHWRFWIDIVHAVPELEDSREIRYQF